MWWSRCWSRFGNSVSVTHVLCQHICCLIHRTISLPISVLNGDYTTCLTHLMKYPGNIDISLVIRYAMHIKSPQTHGCPPGAFPPQFATKREPQPQRPVPPVAVQRAPVVVNHRRAASHDDATAGVRSIKPSTATNSTTTTATDEQLRAHMQAIQKSAAAVHLKTYTGEPDSSIVEGFRVNVRQHCFNNLVFLAYDNF